MPSNKRWPRMTAAAGVLALAISVVLYFRPIEVSLFVTRAGLWLQGERSHDVAIDGHRVHYREMGNGRPIVMVHGLGGSSLDWAPVMRRYARAGYHVYAPDLLGFGKSDKPDVSYSIEEQTSLVHQFMQSQQIQQADVIGWSMGGWIALKLTLEYPEAVRRLVVYDSAGLLFRPGFAPDVFTPATPGEVQTLYSLLEPKGRPLPGFVARDFTRRLHAGSGWVITRAVTSMMTRKDLLDGKLGAIKQPVLIGWGADDELIPVSSGYDMAREMPQADMEVFKGCGHLAPARCAGPVFQKTLQFLQAEQPARGLSDQVAGTAPYWRPH